MPENFLNVETLKKVFSVFPGGVKNVFLNRDCCELLDKVQERDKIAKILESAETELVIKANKFARKEKAEREKKRDIEERGETEDGAEQQIERGHLVDKYVPNKKRPTYRIPISSWLPSLPFIGKKVRSLTLLVSNLGGRRELGERRIGANEPGYCT